VKPIVEAERTPPNIEAIRKASDFWITLKRRVATSGGISWEEVGRMSAFEFFTVVSQIEAETKKK